MLCCTSKYNFFITNQSRIVGAAVWKSVYNTTIAPIPSTLHRIVFYCTQLPSPNKIREAVQNVTIRIAWNDAISIVPATLLLIQVFTGCRRRITLSVIPRLPSLFLFSALQSGYRPKQSPPSKPHAPLVLYCRRQMPSPIKVRLKTW